MKKKFNLFIRFPYLPLFPAEEQAEQNRSQSLYLQAILRDLEARLAEYPWQNQTLETVVLGGSSWWTPYADFHTNLLGIVNRFCGTNGPALVEYRVLPAHLRFLLQNKLADSSQVYLRASSFCDNTLQYFNCPHTGSESRVALQLMQKKLSSFTLGLRLDCIPQSSHDFRDDLTLALCSEASRIHFSGLSSPRDERERTLLRKKRRTLKAAFSCTEYNEYEFEVFSKRPFPSVESTYILGIGAGAFSRFLQADGRMVYAENVKEIDRYLESSATGGRALLSCHVLSQSEEFRLELRKQFLKRDGYHLPDFENTFRLPFEQAFELPLKKLISGNYLNQRASRLYLTEKGFWNLEAVLACFYKDDSELRTLRAAQHPSSPALLASAS